MSWDEVKYTENQIEKGIKEMEATGLPPLNVKKLKATPQDKSVKISFNFPDDTIIDNQILCTVKGVRVVRKLGSPPRDQNDGVILGDFNKKDYPGGGGQNYRQWAFDQDFLAESADAAITYPEGFENSSFKPLMSNVDNGTPTAGGWLSFLKDVLHNEPCFVSRSGVMIEKYDPTNYKKTIEGNDSRVTASSGSFGGSFAWLNKIYTKEIYSTDGNSRRVIFSDGPVDEDFYPKGFVNQDGIILEGVWIPMFNTTGCDGAGQSTINTPINAFNLGNNYNVSALASNRFKYPGHLNKAYTEEEKKHIKYFGGGIYTLLRDLLFMITKTTNSQKACGYGAISYSNKDVYEYVQLKDTSYLENVPGFYGTRANAQNISRTFHSVILNSAISRIFDPYVTFNDNMRGEYRYAEDYNYSLDADSTGLVFGQNKTSETCFLITDNPNATALFSAVSTAPKLLGLLSKKIGSYVKNIYKDGSFNAFDWDNKGLCDLGYCSQNPTGGLFFSSCAHPNSSSYVSGVNSFHIMDRSTSNYNSYNFGIAHVILPDPGYKPY